MKKVLEYLEKLFIPCTAFIGIILVFYSFINYEKKDNILLIAVICAMFLIVMLSYTFWQKVNKNKEVEILEKWIKYDKKREEIEEKINDLTRQLTYYDKKNYLDINRLVFSAQTNLYSNKMINYKNFIEQFGLDLSKMEIEKNTALFLTPFDQEGETLFKKCNVIFMKMGIFLRKTDNYMKKEDIMMNIVSSILESEIILVNINGRNSNVYYELGIAHALGKPTVLLSKNNSDDWDDVGFDIRQKRIVIYRNDSDLEKQLLYILSNIKRNKLD